MRSTPPPPSGRWSTSPRERFTEDGYAGTSLDAIVAGADVTKGALYHHFAGKQAVFEAVFERVEHEASKIIHDAIKHEQDPWEKARAGLRAFLTVVRDPTYRRVVIQDGPAVLGYERFREQEERSTYANVLAIVTSVLRGEDSTSDAADLRHDLLRRDVGGRRVGVAAPRTPRPPAPAWRRAIGFILDGAPRRSLCLDC